MFTSTYAELPYGRQSEVQQSYILKERTQTTKGQKSGGTQKSTSVRRQSHGDMIGTRSTAGKAPQEIEANDVVRKTSDDKQNDYMAIGVASTIETTQELRKGIR